MRFPDHRKSPPAFRKTLAQKVPAVADTVFDSVPEAYCFLLEYVSFSA